MKRIEFRTLLMLLVLVMLLLVVLLVLLLVLLLIAVEGLTRRSQRLIVPRSALAPTYDRADISLAGAIVVAEAMRASGATDMTIASQGLRDAFETMATRLATQGYAVLVVNPYYRSAKTPILRSFSEWQTEEGKAKIAPMREALTAEGIASDGAAFVSWLDAQPEVDTARKLASSGYCMGGPIVMRTAVGSGDGVTYASTSPPPWRASAPPAPRAAATCRAAPRARARDRRGPHPQS